MGGLGTTLWGSLIPGGGAAAAGGGTGTLVLDILYAAMRAAGILARAGRGPSQSELADAFNTFNRLVDTWAARRVFAYNVNFSEFTITPDHQPHTIGLEPGADFNAPRPVRIEAAALVLNTSTPNVDVPLAIRDDDWWATQRVKGIATTVPTDLYYSPNAPNGSIYLWPVPTFAYKLRLEMWVSLAKAENAQSYVILPPGYEEAIIFTLAEKLCVIFGRPVPPDVADQARKARAVVQSNNSKSPRTSSADIGIARRRGGFNYMSGGPA